jgi:hypothetical protein
MVGGEAESRSTPRGGAIESTHTTRAGVAEPEIGSSVSGLRYLLKKAGTRYGAARPL